jgi:hypothetical protein
LAELGVGHDNWFILLHDSNEMLEQLEALCEVLKALMIVDIDNTIKLLWRDPQVLFGM